MIGRSSKIKGISVAPVGGAQYCSAVHTAHTQLSILVRMALVFLVAILSSATVSASVTCNSEVRFRDPCYYDRYCASGRGTCTCGYKPSF